MKLRACTLALTLTLTGCTVAQPEGADIAPDNELSRYDLSQPAGRWPLPAELDEISGLAADGAGGLIAHHDNDARLWRLAVAPALGVAPLAGPWIDGDFEGVARRNGTLYLLRSPGEVYRRPVEPAGPLVLDTAAARSLCNFEGIESIPDGGLLLACKYPRTPQANTVLLFRIDAADGPVTPLALDVGSVLRATGLGRLRPSGLAWLRRGERLLVLAGKERVLLEVDAADWRLLAWRTLAPGGHRQAEGVAVLPDGTLVIADEADGRTAMLTAYGRSE